MVRDTEISLLKLHGRRLGCMRGDLSALKVKGYNAEYLYGVTMDQLTALQRTLSSLEKQLEMDRQIEGDTGD